MKSLNEIRDELASVYSVEKYPVTRMATIGMDGFTQDVNFARRMAADQFFKDGFDAGVKAAEERAQVETEKLTKQIKIMRDALEFYSKASILMMTIYPENRVFKDSIDYIENAGWMTEKHIKDNGDRARQALKEAGEV